jgi:hypothetical protein
MFLIFSIKAAISDQREKQQSAISRQLSAKADRPFFAES